MFMHAIGINSTARRAIEIIPFLDIFNFPFSPLFVGNKWDLNVNKYLQEKGNWISFASIFLQKT